MPSARTYQTIGVASYHGAALYLRHRRMRIVLGAALLAALAGGIFALGRRSSQPAIH